MITGALNLRITGFGFANDAVVINAVGDTVSRAYLRGLLLSINLLLLCISDTLIVDSIDTNNSTSSSPSKCAIDRIIGLVSAIITTTAITIQCCPTQCTNSGANKT